MRGVLAVGAALVLASVVTIDMATGERRWRSPVGSSLAEVALRARAVRP